MQTRAFDLEIDLPPTVDAPSIARGHVHTVARACPTAVRSDAELVVSELVTTALGYADEALPIRLRLRARPALCVEIEHLPAAAPDTERIPSVSSWSWGQDLVSTLADAWGVTARDGRMSAWAELRPDR
jgi:hypothetical protein